MRCKAKDVFEIGKMFDRKVINNFKSFPFVRVMILIIKYIKILKL